MMGFYPPPSHSYCPSSFWNWNSNCNGKLRMKSNSPPNLLFLSTSTSASTTKRLKKNSIINASSSSSSSSSGSEKEKEKEKERQRLSRSAAYSLLKQQLSVATKFEDYKEAARLRDSLRRFEEEEPVLRLRNLLTKAVQDQRFHDAAKYRDQLKELAPHALLKCSSDATTLGIRVQVRSVYVESRSRPMEGQFFYAYRIRITNNSGRAVQLLRRHWIVTDGWGRAEHVWGTGVVGQQPVIPPGAAFEYSSACPLGTPSGRMEGDFEMKPLLLPDSSSSSSSSSSDRFLSSTSGAQNKSTSTSTFNVAIAPFSLSVLGDDDCSSSSAFLY